jgi:hypothetical protein
LDKHPMGIRVSADTGEATRRAPREPRLSHLENETFGPTFAAPLSTRRLAQWYYPPPR